MSRAAHPSSLRLDEQLCFALYAASRAMTAAYRPLLAPHGITYPQFLVMLVLWEHTPMTVGALAERLHLETGTVSPLLKRLEGAGLVARRRQATDERSVLVEPTPQGAALLAEVECIPAQVAEATGLTTAEITGLQETLGRLRDHLGW